MNRQAWLIGVIGLVLMGACACLLMAFDGKQRLGKPGVKVVQQPMFDADGKMVATNSVHLPERVLDYESALGTLDRTELNMLPPDTTYGRRHYTSGRGDIINVSVVLMGTDRTSIHKPEYCLPGQGFNIDKAEVISIPIVRPQPFELPAMKMMATKVVKTPQGGKTTLRAIYIFWFVADNELTADHVQRMWWMARDLIRTGTLQRWAYVGCLSVCYPGQEEETFGRMKQFIAAAVPEFQLAAGSTINESSQVSVSQRR